MKAAGDTMFVHSRWSLQMHMECTIYAILQPQICPQILQLFYVHPEPALPLYYKTHLPLLPPVVSSTLNQSPQLIVVFLHLDNLFHQIASSFYFDGYEILALCPQQMAFAVLILESKPSFLYPWKYVTRPSMCLRVALIHTTLSCNFFLTILTQNKTSSQITYQLKFQIHKCTTQRLSITYYCWIISRSLIQFLQS